MITKLKIQNFALIEDIEIQFESGLTVLTGETGTGKTIILEALHLLFGKRSDQTMIRHGKNKAIVTGHFKLNKVLQEKHELNEYIVVRREIDILGKHKVLLNGSSITLSNLKTIMEDFCSMHSQNETMQLLDPKTYLNYIDDIDTNKINKVLNQYLILRSNFLAMQKKLKKLKIKKGEDTEKQEFFKYQLKELSELNLELDEKKALTDKINELSHFDSISLNLKESYQLKDDIDFNNIYMIGKKINDLSNYIKDFSDESEKIFDMYYYLEELKSNISNKIQTLNFDQALFD